jgi:hypothetical protein
MSQRQALAAIDADLHAAFLDAGLADVGDYTAPDAAPGADPVACRVYIDRDSEIRGETRQFPGGRVEVGYVLADVTPAKNGRLSVDNSLYINDELVSNDGSLARWVVRRG